MTVLSTGGGHRGAAYRNDTCIILDHEKVEPVGQHALQSGIICEGEAYDSAAESESPWSGLQLVNVHGIVFSFWLPCLHQWPQGRFNLVRSERLIPRK